MRVLIEAHHPAHIHFWKYPIAELTANGHHVRMIARDRDVMHRLLKAYDWITYTIPTHSSKNNIFPLAEFIQRQLAVISQIRAFRPDVFASLMGSYSQCARVFGVRNLVFTDSEFQRFNHFISHPFADEIHTPYCYYKNHGRKQRYYNGIHELCFLNEKYFHPNLETVQKYEGLDSLNYIIIRLSAWNTLHDIKQRGISTLLEPFIRMVGQSKRIIISAEENKVDQKLRQYCMNIDPQDMHDLLAYSSFVLTEGASTASEAACLGVPTVYINSTEPRGYLNMLEKEYGIVRTYRLPEPGLQCAQQWFADSKDAPLDRHMAIRHKISSNHLDVCNYVINTILKDSK